MENELRPEGIGEDGHVTIRDLSHAPAILEEAKGRIFKVNESKPAPTFHHAESANLILKVINVGIKDEFIRKVMTKRILGPIIDGREKSHLSIALEMGAREHEVIEAERAGVGMMTHLIENAQDCLEKFNREMKV